MAVSRRARELKPGARGEGDWLLGLVLGRVCPESRLRPSPLLLRPVVSQFLFSPPFPPSFQQCSQAYLWFLRL